jgi:hypothetical protein
MKTKLIITILLLLFLHSVVEAQSKKKGEYVDCKWLKKECETHPLNILHFFAYESIDSLKGYKMKHGYKYYVEIPCYFNLFFRYIRLGRMNLCKSLRVILYHFIN